MLTLRNISRSYPQRGQVLKNLELDVEKRDTLAITGPSGSGKTTLLNIIGLLDQTETGELKFNGKEVSGLSQDEAAQYRHNNIGFIFQDHLLLPYLSVIENIELPLLASSPESYDTVNMRDYISGLMAKCGISELEKKLPHQISGGEAQRVTLVRALVNRPSLLLADEPTGSLDITNADILANLLIEMNREYETTIITVTHSPNLANKMGRVFELKNGSLISLKGK
ncbi:MAG TPA: ABC transporter ATP-binding protein [Bacteroidales bacterium]|nr:ABC transporter ATP-binding protein [Bacteroidales bacterium]